MILTGCFGRDMLLARKSVKQRMMITTITAPTAYSFQRLMESFRAICNDAIRIGLAADVSSLKCLSKLAYGPLKEYGDVPSYYRLCAISKVAGILPARKKSIKRGFANSRPYLSKPLLVSCYGFKIDDDGALVVPLGGRRFARIPLNAHTREVISQPGVTVRSFTLSEGALSLCIAKNVEEEVVVHGAMGVDRNLRNITLEMKERSYAAMSPRLWR